MRVRLRAPAARRRRERRQRNGWNTSGPPIVQTDGANAPSECFYLTFPRWTGPIPSPGLDTALAALQARTFRLLGGESTALTPATWVRDVSERLGRQRREAECVVKFAEREQAGVGGDGGAVEFE